MILDTENLFSDDQAITTTADSTNVIQLPANTASGAPLHLLIQVTTTFAGGTSIAVDIETDALVSMGSPTNIYTGAVIATATLVAGYEFSVHFMPRSNEPFTRLEYTVVGTMTAGNITAGIVYGHQTNKQTFPS